MRKIMLITSIACLLSSCAGGKGGNSAISEDGNCTSETVGTYNDIVNKAQMYDLTHDKAYVSGIINSCSKLQSALGSSSCKAENTKSGETMNVSYATVKNVCDIAQNLK